MPIYRIERLVIALVMLLLGTSLRAHAIDTRFELKPSLLDKKTRQTSAEAPSPTARSTVHPSGELSEYVIKPGDHIYKILVTEYGLKSREAEALIPDVKHINGITNIRGLRVGQVIRVPLPARLADSEKVTAREKLAATTAGSDAGIHPLRMVADVPPRQSDGFSEVRQVWDKLVPGTKKTDAPVDLRTRNFSLTLDPSSYPSLPAADGGRIIVDANRKLPAPVISLLEEKDSKLRVVAEDPRNRRRFMAALLENAKFYSVEENFAVDFGSDPKLTVNAEYKIEKSPESLLRHDIVLMNVNENWRSMPQPLVNFLGKEGFQVIEPFYNAQRPTNGRNTLYQIKSKDPQGIVDSLLKALSFSFDSNRNIELYSFRESGLKLDIRAERYFEEKGDRYVVNTFDGDPVNYTLSRLLETKGYKVIMLEAKDDFRKVAEKILSRVKLSGFYGKHDLWSLRDTPYRVQMSGIMLRDRNDRGNIFLTNGELDTLFRDLVSFNGYSIVNQ